MEDTEIIDMASTNLVINDSKPIHLSAKPCSGQPKGHYPPEASSLHSAR